MTKVLRQIGFLGSLMLILGITTFAQNVNVTATGGTANATYATVKASFDAINAGTHTGAITLEIAANTTEPNNTSAVLNSSGAGAASGASTTNAANVPGTITDSSQTVSNVVASNFTVENISVINAGRGINLKGFALTNFPNVLIRRNLLGNPNEGEPNQLYHYGITVSGSTGGTISDNTVYVEGFLNIIPRGIDVGFGSSVNTGGIIVERNQVRRAKAKNPGGAAASGISINTNFGNTVRNNFISGVSGGNAGIFNVFVATNGIYIGRGPNHRIYNNTVLMSGDLFGGDRTLSTAIGFDIGSGSGIDCRNNILINTQTQSGAADPSLSAFVAIYLPAQRTASYNLTLNNNDYYTGTAVNNGIAQVGNEGDMPGAGFYPAANFDPNATTPATNFRAYSSILNNSGTNDNQSKKIDPLLLSATDLHISPASPMVNMGAEVGVFNDIDGQLRVGIPDIGADEPDGLTPPAKDISATALVSPLNGALLSPTTSVTPSAQFTNFGTATQTNVTVRYQIINSSNAVVYNQTATIASIEQNQVVTVTFPATTISPAGTYTIRATAELAGDANAANDSISGTVSVLAPISGTINVGAGQTYTSLTNSGGLFESLNIGGANGNLVVNITSNLTTESGAIRLNELSGGASLTLKPSGAARTISGSANAGTALIKLDGADNVTIDGSLNSGTDRSLTIANTSGGAIIWIASSETNGANGNTVKNCILNGSGAESSLGIVAGAGF